MRLLRIEIAIIYLVKVDVYVKGRATSGTLNRRHEGMVRLAEGIWRLHHCTLDWLELRLKRDNYD